MSKYEVGITDINVLVRRLGYVSAILRLLEHNTLSESMLYSRLEKWSLDHKQNFDTYPLYSALLISGFWYLFFKPTWFQRSTSNFRWIREDIRAK